MAKPQDFQIKESSESLQLLRRKQTNIRFEKRVLWLIYIQSNKFKTRKELCEYLVINPRTQERWTKQYIDKGV